MKLYEINAEILRLTDAIEFDEETGEILGDADELFTQIQSLQIEKKSILEYLAKLVLNIRSEEAAVKTEEQAERDILAEREAALAKQLAEMRGKKRKLVDPLQYALSIAAEDLTNYVPTFAWEMAPPSEKQIAFLERRGIFADSVRNAGLASLLIDRLQRRQQMGLATPKQIRCLERYGFRQVGT